MAEMTIEVTVKNKNKENISANGHDRSINVKITSEVPVYAQCVGHTAHGGIDGEDNEFRPLEPELDEYHPKASRMLFIGNLNPNITVAKIMKHFNQFGKILEIDIKKQGVTASYAFVQYSDIESVVRAINALNGVYIKGNLIKLAFGKSIPTNCLWLDVSNVVIEDVIKHIAKHIYVIHVSVIEDHALVCYTDYKRAMKALKDLKGCIFDGKKLQVDFASKEYQFYFFSIMGLM